MNLKNVCRTCLRIPKKSSNLFINREILHRIDVITSIKLQNTEELSEQICDECLSNVNYLFKFRKLIVNTNNDLQQRLKILKQTNFLTKPEKMHVKDRTAFLYKNLKLEDESDKNTSDPDDSLITVDKGSKNIKKYRRKRSIEKCICKCDQCDKIFDTRVKLHTHRFYNHSSRGTSYSICNVCGAQIRAYNMNAHMKIHSDEPCGCKECGKIFKNSSSLRCHMLRHSDKAIICEVCGKKFNIRQKHVQHMKMHEDPNYLKKPCHLCGLKIVGSNMEKHMLKHNSERSHICSVCTKSFVTFSALQVHIRRHTNGKSYLCEYCSSSFSQRLSLQIHLKKEHGILLTG